MMRTGSIRVAAWLAAATTALQAQAAYRFPRPDFTTGYEPPTYQHPVPRAGMWEAVDIALLAVALGLAA